MVSFAEIRVVVLIAALAVVIIDIAVIEAYRRARRRLDAETISRLTHEETFLSEQMWRGQDGLGFQRVNKLLERIDLQERLLNQRLLRNIFLALVFVEPALGAALTVVIDHDLGRAPIITAAFFVLSAIGFLMARARQLDLDARVLQADYELGLLVTDPSPALRAERLYLKAQFELKRYYDQILRQAIFTSYLGGACVAGGFVIVGVTFALVLWSGSSGREQLLIGIVGGASGVLANFVAAVFLRMHSGSIETLSAFHSSLVRTNHALFANVVAGRIGDPDTPADQSKQLGAIVLGLLAASGRRAPDGED
jgi:hypothetical protein